MLLTCIADIHSHFQKRLIMCCSLKQTLSWWQLVLYAQRSFMYKQSWLNPVTTEDDGCGSQSNPPSIYHVAVLCFVCCFFFFIWAAIDREAATCTHTVVHAHHSRSHSRDWTSHLLTLPHCNCQLLQRELFLRVGSCMPSLVWCFFKTLHSLQL